MFWSRRPILHTLSILDLSSFWRKEGVDLRIFLRLLSSVDWRLEQVEVDLDTLEAGDKSISGCCFKLFSETSLYEKSLD